MSNNERIITIYQSDGGEIKDLNSSVTTFGELKQLLMREGIPIDNRKFIEGDTQVTYDHPDAVLPAGDFTLFSMFEKSKFGADWDDVDYMTCRSQIRELIAEYNGDAREHFNSGGLNYTNKPLEELRRLLNTWSAPDRREVDVSVNVVKIDRIIEELEYLDAEDEILEMAKELRAVFVPVNSREEKLRERARMIKDRM